MLSYEDEYRKWWRWSWLVGLVYYSMKNINNYKN